VIPPPAPAGRPRKRSAAAAALAAEAGPEMWFPTIFTRVRAFSEEIGDAKRAVSLVRLRKQRRPGRFDTHRLRVLEDFALSVGGGGLSVLELNELPQVLDTWDRTSPEMPDDGDHRTIRDAFKSPNEFRQALSDGIDEGVNQNDWKQCTLEQSGMPYEVYFRPALGVLMEALQSASRMRYWSGSDCVAETPDKREFPFDGDAFRECEADVVGTHGYKAFVLVFYAYSDTSVFSWSGGTFLAVFACWCSSLTGRCKLRKGIGRQVLVRRDSPLTARALTCRTPSLSAARALLAQSLFLWANSSQTLSR